MQKFCVLLLTLFLFSCSKNTSTETGTGNNNNNNNGGNNNGGTTTGYYIKFSMDGATKTFKTNAMAIVTTNSGATNLAMVANAATTSLEGINITIGGSTSGNAIVPGTYSEDGSPNFLVAGVYNPGSTSIIYSAGLHASTGNPLKIVISDISTSTVKGTFGGDFWYSQVGSLPTSSDKKVLSNGEFYLPVSKQ
ncbi:MAG: hypothetical protein JST68_22580 [Bacteroidetes bacterium]|nr:hypothetical protein [Bacteroidota bacterium]